MTFDILDGAAAGKELKLDSMIFGGAPSPEMLPKKARQVLPSVVM